MTYNVSFMDNTTSFLQVAQGVNAQSDGLFSIMFLCVFFLLILMVFAHFDTKSVLLADSFITTIIAVLLFGAGMLEGWFLGVVIAALVFSLIAKVWGDS